MGKHQARLLRFFLRYPNAWHMVSYKDPCAIAAMRSLEREGFIQIAPHTRGQNPKARIMIGDRVWKKHKGTQNVST